jgi:hypothetical protein
VKWGEKCMHFGIFRWRRCVAANSGLFPDLTRGRQVARASGTAVKPRRIIIRPTIMDY